MSQSTETLKDDIAYMTGLAREGHKPTHAGGEYLLMCGLIFGGTSFAVSASLAGYLKIGMSWLWLGSMVLFAICLPVLIVRSRRRAAFQMLGNRTIGQAWTAIGWAIFTLAIATGAVSWQLNSGAPTWLFAPTILALYGVGWSVSASLSESAFAKVLAVGSFVASVLVALLVKSPALMFIGYGVALILLAAVPGAISMRLNARSEAQG